MRVSLTRRVSLGLIALLVVFAAAVGGAADARAATTATTEVISGTLPDGTLWRVAKPTPWNGTIVLDLDGFANAAPTNPGVLQQWMTESGYAIGGTQREPVGYEFPKAVDNLLAVRDAFIARFGAPTRTLTIGSSRGGFVSRLAMELHPEIFKGAVLSAGGGAGEIATFNAHLDGLFALKSLVNPSASIALGLVTDPTADNAAINTLVRQAMQTPLGRARLGLAAALEQMPLWANGPTPPPEGDANAWIQQIGGELNPVVGTVFGFANPAQVRQGIQRAAGGNPFWNDNVNYTALLLRSGRAKLVTDLYRQAGGLNLLADLWTLARAPRISADPAAVATAERKMTYTGEIRGPVIVVDNIGDPVDSEAYKRAYERTVTRAGNGRLLRTAWVASAGHGNQTALERIAGFSRLIERLDSGQWNSTSPDAMNALAAQIQVASPLALGASRFIPYDPVLPTRGWDASDWGHYRPRG
jgi:pimeloyl-ACP methyl ester carboxylesterase